MSRPRIVGSRPESPWVFTSFVFPFANFFQPGIFWPQIADYRPLQIVAIVALLASLGAKATYSRMDALRSPSAKWLLFFLFLQPLSVYRTGVYGMFQESNFWLTYALFLLVSLRIIDSPQGLRRYIWGMMVGSAWIVFWGIYAVFAGLEDLTNGGRAGAYGMYENHNDYSFIIVQTLPFYFIYWRTETGFLRRALLGAATLGSVLGIFMSLSRGGMMALVLEAALIVIFTTKKRTQWILLPLVFALGAGAISYQYIKRAQNQGDSYTAEDAESSRWELWQAGGGMIQAHPLLGVGSRSFGENSTSYGEISHDNLGKNAHNTFIEAAATTGLLGLLALVKMLLVTLKDLRRKITVEATSWELNTRKATLIALYTIIFRSLFDAKSWDWSYYVLITIAMASSAMLKNRAAIAPDAPPDAAPAAPAQDIPWSNKLP
jgi:O-antigen ligase